MRKALTKSLVLLSLVMPLYSRQSIEFANGPKIFVIAVRTLGDAPILSTCLVAKAQKGVRIASSQQFPGNTAPFHAPQLFPSQSLPIPGGVPDDNVRTRIGKEFEKQKRYLIVNDLAQADLVFFAEVRLNSLVSAYLVPTDRIKRPDPRRTSNTRRNDTSTIPLPDTNVATGSTYVRIGGQDEAPNSMEMASAIVVRTQDYRNFADNMEALLKARIWESSSGPQKLGSAENPAPGVLESLVRQFLAAKKLPSSHLLCATAQPNRVPSLNAISTYKTALPTLITQSASKPTPQNSASATDPNKIRVDVSLVTVPLTATDTSGAPILNLNASDFHVFEDGVEQKIDRLISVSEPFNVALLLDTSRSMRSAFNEIRKYIVAFSRLLRADDRMLLSSFNSRIYLDCDFTNDRNRLLDAASGMRDGVYTRLYDALYLLLTERLSFAPDRKALVLVTDGLDTGSGLADINRVLTLLQEANAPVYIIQYEGGAQDMPAMQAIPKKTAMAPTKMAQQAMEELHSICDTSGGKLYEAGTLMELNEAFNQIAKILHQQYTICYYPSNSAAGASFRSIRVAIDRPDTKIKARSGYRPHTSE
jgi:VWFA-related protein